MKTVPTLYPVVNCVMAYDSSVVIVVSAKNHYECWVKMYDLESHVEVFQEKIGGNPDQYIKIKYVV